MAISYLTEEVVREGCGNEICNILRDLNRIYEENTKRIKSGGCVSQFSREDLMTMAIYYPKLKQATESGGSCKAEPFRESYLAAIERIFEVNNVMVPRV